MRAARQWIFVMLTAVIVPTTCCRAQTPPQRAAYKPESTGEAGWSKLVIRQQSWLNNQPCRVCFIGDSLTKFWEDTGRPYWETEIAPLKAINLGITADRTEHILYRIQRLDFRRANPKVIVLMMGTNNLGKTPPDRPEDLVRAVDAGVSMLRAQLPGASFLLLTIPPSGDEPGSVLRQNIKQANDLLMKHKWAGQVRVLSIYDAMVDGQDRWRDGYTLDGTHFSETGYAKLTDLVSPVVKDMLGK
jgi:lysophospholipase L1-like esterase